MSGVTRVVSRHHQRLGLRGVAVELAYLLGVTAVFTVIGRQLVVAALLGLAASAVRLSAFVGYRRRRIEVTPLELRIGGTSIPLADVVDVEALAGAELRAHARAPGPGFAVRTHAALREGIGLRVRSPEGIDIDWTIGADDGEALATAVRAQLPASSRPPGPIAPAPLPFTGRQGLRPAWVVPIVVLFVTLDGVSVANGLVPLTTAPVVAFLAWTGARRVTIDDEGIRVGTFRRRWDAIESARLAPFAEASVIDVGRTRNPPWGARWAIVVVERGDGRPRDRATTVGVPTPIALPATVDPTIRPSQG
jgi:hypothetical protein